MTQNFIVNFINESILRVNNNKPKMSLCVDQTNLENFRAIFNLSPGQQYTTFILSPFIYLSAFVSIVFFLKNRKRTQPPADILFCICVFGVLRISSYLASASKFLLKAVYDQSSPPSMNGLLPDSYTDFCSGTGFINVLCQLASFVYNVVFCVYYVVKIKNPLKSWIKDNREIHIVCLFLVVVSTIIFYLTDLIGISVLGVCGYKIGSGVIFLDVLLTSSFFVVMFISSIFFIKYLRSISRQDTSNKMYFRFYFKYLILSSIIHLLGIISLFVATIKCLKNQVDSDLETFAIICNITRLLSPVMVFLVILGHPQLKIYAVLRYFNECCFNQKTKKNQVQIFYEDLMSTKRNSIMIQLSDLNNRPNKQQDFLSKIKDKNKACLINTILGCLALQQSQFFDRKQLRESFAQMSPNSSIRIQDLRLSSLDYSDEQIFGWNFCQSHQFQLTQQIAEAYQQIFSPNFPTIKIKFISHNLSIFKQLQHQQKIFELYEKLLPTKNERNILDNMTTDGGRSGQFFFFNYDSTLIIKTINSNQLRVVREKMKDYYEHFMKNGNSLIVKIFGLYEVVNVQTNEEISFMLMGNLLKNIPKHYVLKSYDMKGSTYQRQVLKDSQMRDRQSSQISTTKTLKDIDFYVLQGKVHISKQDSDQIKKIISEDINFLCSQGLIDYSLIVMKVNYAKFLQQEKGQATNVKMYKSTKQPGVTYIFGIIDYLQTWNIRKKGQKWYKSIMHKQQSISSQDPTFYSQRFMKNLINMILP